jgi:MinD-like ATPase involved in chromosome partitioning or flagellar assembly
MDHRVIGVLGASGGAGASTLAVALGVRAARRLGVTACVDGDLWGGGLDVTACLEHLPGLRWGDLAEASGELDGAALLRALPTQDGIGVLAAGEVPVDADVARRAVHALSRLCAVTVVDLGSGGVPAAAVGLGDCCTDLVVLAGTSARQLADGVAAAGRLGRQPQLQTAGLVLRTPRRDRVEPEQVALRLDLPLVTVLPDDSRVDVDADRGRVPGTRSSSRLVGVADRILDWLELADEAALGVSA